VEFVTEDVEPPEHVLPVIPHRTFADECVSIDHNLDFHAGLLGGGLELKCSE
jgi:hypothetical protein